MHLKKPILLFLLFSGHFDSVKADTVDNYQIYIKNVLVTTESSFDPSSTTISTFLRLNKSNFNESIVINFNHCTAGAANRHMALRDTAGKVIIHWNFPDKDVEDLMLLPVKSILNNEIIKQNSILNLYYFDDQLPAGILLTYIHIEDKPLMRESSQMTPTVQNKKLSLWVFSLVASLFFFIFMWRRRRTNR